MGISRQAALLIMQICSVIFNTGSAIFIATHILSSFSIKPSEIENLLDGFRANDTIEQWSKHLFNMATFIFNDRLQSTLESFTGGNQYFLRDQYPFS